MTLERQARGFFQRMNDYVNGQSSNNQAALKLNRADLIGSMAGNRNTFAAYDDYYDDYSGSGNRGSSINRQGGGYGHHGGHHGGYCEEDQVSIGLLVVSLAGIALMFYTLLTKIQANGGRRKRDTDYDPFPYLWSFFESDGLEDFENKIDKIASGDDKGENSWINDVYNKYGNGTEDDDNEVVPNVEGLEPPMLDETWGLIDGEEKETSTPRVKRNHEPIDDQFKKDFDDIYETDGATCKTKMWRCFSRVAEGSLHYLSDPGGITGAIKNNLFKLAFQGAMGNAWGTLMSIPEARKVQLCNSAHDKCLEKEVLKNELGNDIDDKNDKNGENDKNDRNDNRFLINPEFVQSLDESDGSKAFDFNGEGTEGFD